jgi:ATP-dependent Clp protease adaptor protein ClpS
VPATVIQPRTDTNTRTMPLYKVLVHNDDHNSMDHVVRSLVETFRFEIPEAAAIMLEAHESGVALCKVEPQEYAELHRDKLQAFGLISTVEPDE